VLGRRRALDPGLAGMGVVALLDALNECGGVGRHALLVRSCETGLEDAGIPCLTETGERSSQET
jgi:hypothetical protein